jgi:hypothetical protein
MCDGPGNWQNRAEFALFRTLARLDRVTYQHLLAMWCPGGKPRPNKKINAAYQPGAEDASDINRVAFLWRECGTTVTDQD